jgi:methyltransferase (TIGR00027 family)
MEGVGAPRTIGRIYGWLMICDPPQRSLTELATALGLSKASVSTMIRPMQEGGLVERQPSPSHQHHYRIADSRRPRLPMASCGGGPITVLRTGVSDDDWEGRLHRRAVHDARDIVPQGVGQQGKQPILDDHFAAEAVDRIDYDWKKVDKPNITRNRAGIALRAKQFDGWAADFVRRTPDATVLQLACGLDSRAFRLNLPAGVRWFDVDLPDVMELRRKLYDDTDGYRMIAASVTDAAWLDEIPTDKPALIIAEGVLMYLHETDVRQLLRRLTDHFRTGELIFDGVAAWMTTMTQLLKKYLSRWYPYPAYRTATRDSSDIQRWNPRLRYRDHIAIMAQYEQVPGPKLRRLYRAASRFDWSTNFLRVSAPSSE